MNHELYWLTLTALMTALFWMPYVLGRFAEFGIFKVILDGNSNSASEQAWANRAIRAHKNAVENLVIFSTLVITLQFAGTSSTMTAMATTAYFFARLAHFIVYTAGLPIIRTVTFLIGFGCQMILALSLIGLV